MALYWYGRTSTGMPLLKYLAYYQCIEFYFPTYYHTELKRRVQNLLKDPTFRAEKDADIGRVLVATNVSTRSRIPDEKSMLRATIRGCIEEKELRDYFNESEGRLRFFSAIARGLTDRKIAFNDAESDIRDAVADRIYDIRCKIVHNKSGGNDEGELLLPFSKGAEQLAEDIALVEFISQKLLIAASVPIKVW